MRRLQSAALALVLVAASGCLAAREAPPGAGGPAGVSPSAAPAPVPVVTPAPSPEAEPARVADAGLAFSGCTFRSNVLLHRHEWASPLVPPEYRQVNLAANTGTNVLEVTRCQAVTVGNATLFAGAAFAYYAVQVRAPAGLEGPETDFFVLDIASDDAGLAAQFREVWPFAVRANITIDDSSYGVHAPGRFTVRVDETEARDVEDETTVLLRLHWLRDGASCWADLGLADSVTDNGSALLTAEEGSAQVVSGGTGRLVGISQRGVESGTLTAPQCTGAAG